MRLCKFNHTFNPSVFLTAMFFSFVLASVLFAQDSDGQPAKQDIKAQIAEIDKELDALEKEKNANSREINRVVQDIYEYRTDPDMDDPELKELKTSLLEAEKKYKKLLKEFNKKLLEQSEIKELKEIKDELMKRSRKIRQEHSELLVRKLALKDKLEDREKGDGDASSKEQ